MTSLPANATLTYCCTLVRKTCQESRIKRGLCSLLTNAYGVQPTQGYPASKVYLHTVTAKLDIVL